LKLLSAFQHRIIIKIDKTSFVGYIDFVVVDIKFNHRKISLLLLGG